MAAHVSSDWGDAMRRKWVLAIALAVVFTVLAIGVAYAAEITVMCQCGCEREYTVTTEVLLEGSPDETIKVTIRHVGSQNSLTEYFDPDEDTPISTYCSSVWDKISVRPLGDWKSVQSPSNVVVSCEAQ